MGDPLGTIASIIVVIDLSTKVVGYLRDVKGGAEQRLHLRDEIRNCINLLERLRDRAEDAEYRDTWASSIQSLGSSDGPIDQFRRTLEQLTEMLVPA
jgi:hypothetical protein